MMKNMISIQIAEMNNESLRPKVSTAKEYEGSSDDLRDAIGTGCEEGIRCASVANGLEPSSDRKTAGGRG